MKYIQSVAEADHDIAAQIFLCIQEQTIRAFCRVSARQFFDLLIDSPEALFAEQIKHMAKPALGQRFQIAGSAGVLLHIIEQRGEQVQFRLRPKIVRFLFAGGIDNDRGRNNGNQPRIMVGFADRVPMIGMIHIQQIEHPHFITLILEVACHAAIQLGFRIGDHNAFPAFYALEDKRPHKAPAFARPWRAYNQQIAGQSRFGTGRHIIGETVCVLRVILMLSVNCAS